MWQVSPGQYVRAPSPVRMSKAPAVQPARLRRQGASFGSHSSQAATLLAPAGQLSAHATTAPDDATAATGLMTRVTSLLNRALCKPSARGPEASFAGNKRTAAAYLSS